MKDGPNLNYQQVMDLISIIMIYGIKLWDLLNVVIIDKIKALFINIMDPFVGIFLVVKLILNGENVQFVCLDGIKLITNIVQDVDIL